MRVIAAIAGWFDHRLQLAAPIRDVVDHPVPRNTASWWYVFGSAALPKTYHQLAVLRGTACSAASRIGAASCSRWSNHSAMAAITRMAASPD